MPQYSPNLLHLHKCFSEPDITGAVLEGSSRSIKTWSGIDFLVWYAATREHKTANIIKETYNSFKTTLYDDFNRRLPAFGLQSPFAERQEVSSFSLLGNKVNLIGADSYKEGTTCDIFFCNEMLDIPQTVFNQAEQRCREFWWGDYNPKTTEHWVFDKLDKRPDVKFLKTTFADNPYIAAVEKRKILSYDPNNKENVRNGTADDFMWNVYGLGIRSAPEGLVFQHVTWVKQFPHDCERVYYGIDWGYTNDPTCLMKIGVMGKNLFAQVLHYAPTPSWVEVEPVLKIVGKGPTIWADPSGEYGERYLITLARKNGYRCIAYNAYPGSIRAGISILKNYKIHLIDCPEWRKEQGGYKFREVNGIRLDEPVDANNHAWDATRGVALGQLTRKA